MKMSHTSSPICKVSTLILTYSLLVATLSFVTSGKHKTSDHNLSTRNVPYRTNDTLKLNRSSFYRLSKSNGVREVTSTEEQINQNGLQSTFYGTGYAYVRYYIDTEASKAPVLDMNSTKYDVKNGSDFTDVAKTELTTKRPPLNISVDRIISVPRRKCPDGQKMDLFGKCKTVWNT